MSGDFRFEPVTVAHWKDIERLFGVRGACGGCWCMSWRKPKRQFEHDKGAVNRANLKSLVMQGPPPGILAYSGDRPVGWCAVAPRPEYVTLATSRVLKPLDDAPVWSVSCLFIDKGFRRKGLSVDLLEAAVALVKQQGGRLSGVGEDCGRVAHVRLDGSAGSVPEGWFRGDAPLVGESPDRAVYDLKVLPFEAARPGGAASMIHRPAFLHHLRAFSAVKLS